MLCYDCAIIGATQRDPTRRNHIVIAIVIVIVIVVLIVIVIRGQGGRKS